MSSHTIYLPDLQSRINAGTGHTPGAPSEQPVRLLVGGDEAKHAIRVKRLEAGDSIRLVDGRGAAAEAKITDTRKERRTGEWVLEAELSRVEVLPEHAPRLHVLAGAPKGDAIEQMIDGLSQVGAASWAPLISLRSVVEPREGKLRRLERVAEEALKQCGRDRLLAIGDNTSLDEALARGGTIVAADGSGERYTRTGAPEITLLIGPEGGWDTRELAKMKAAGVRVANFGPHIMRIETAAIVCAAMVVAEEAIGKRP